MTTEIERRSAIIYEFPRKARTPSMVAVEANKPIARLTPVLAARTTFSSGWYHEAAIEEAEPSRRQ
jgi:hypothetical protein